MTYSCRKRGSTLSLVVISAFVMVLVGIGIYFLIKIFGGGAEVSNAVDAGTLNVAKQATVNPNVPLSSIANLANTSTTQGSPNQAQILSTLERLLDTKYGGGTPSAGVADLLKYNVLVGQVLLASMNAEADGGTNAIANAQTAITLLQAPNNSIGQLLQAQLAALNWTQAPFNQVAQSNSVRMAQVAGIPSWQNSALSYVGQPATASYSSTNVQINGTYSTSGISVNNLLPYSDYQKNQQVSWPANATDSSGNYLNGYSPIAVGNVGTIYGVPVSPQNQSHLLSQSTFGSSLNQPGSGSVTIPANTFACTAQVTDQQTHVPVQSWAAGIVASAAFPDRFALSIPNGYIVIDNSGTGIQNQGAVFNGPLPELDNVTAQELSTGISATALPSGNGLFSNNGALEAWSQFNANGGTGSPPSLNGLFDAQGQPATQQEASQAAGAPCTCTDFNSDGPNSVPVCQTLLENPVATSPQGQPIGAFDNAYYGQNTSYGLASQAPNLTADEYAAVQLASGYGQAYISSYLQMAFSMPFSQWVSMGIDPHNPATWGDTYTLVLPSNPGVTTGMRLYNASNNPMIGEPAPWCSGYTGGSGGPTGAIQGFGDASLVPSAPSYSNPYEFGVVTQPGSLLQLVQQTTTGLPYTRTNKGNTTPVPIAPPAGQQASDEIQRFITNRIYQIKPNASQSEISNILNQTLALGGIYYIYLDPTSGNITINTTAPPQVFTQPGQGTNYVPPLSGSGYLVADGTPTTFTATFPLLSSSSAYGTMVNAQYYDGAELALFTTQVSPGTVTGQHTVTYTPGTGAYNNLGVVQLQDTFSETGPPTFSGRN